jgi:tetratricopeptide (TPR) repeat protein
VFAFTASTVFAQTPGVQAPSDRAQIYFFFANAKLLESQGQFERGVEELKKALALQPNSSFLFSSIADMYQRNRRPTEAADYAEKAVQADPNNADPHRLLSRVYVEIYSNAVRRGSQQERTAALNRAIHEFEEIVRIDPGDQTSFLNLGRLYEEQGQPQKAEEIYRKLLGSAPDSEQAIKALAQLQLDSGNFDGAVGSLEKFLASRPDSEEAWQMLGDAYSSVDKYDKAAEAYKHAADLVPDDLDFQKAYAQALYQDTQYEEAGKVFQNLYRQDPNDLTSLVLLSEVYRHQMGSDKSKYELARAILLRAAALVPDNAQIELNLALLDRDDGRLEDSLKRLTDLARRTERRNYNEQERAARRRLITQIAMLHSTMGHYDDAIKSFTELRGLTAANDRGRVDSFIVSTYREARNLDKALEYADTAIKEFPTSRPLIIQRADIFADKGRVAEAVEMLEKISKDDLDIASAIIGIYERAKKFADAQRVLDAAAKRFPDDLNVHFLQGALYEKQNKVSDAEASFRKALTLEKNNAPAMNYLGYMLADRNLKLDEALKLIQKAVEVDPGNGAYLDSLGWVYFRLNRLDLAEEFLKKATRFVDNDADIHDHLAELHYKRGEYENAKKEWSKALNLSTDDDDIQRIQKKLDDLKTKVAEK